jgi:threonine dehydratase
MFEISLEEIEQARQRIRDKVNRTPCVYSLPLSRMTGKEVFLKLENLQVTQAFKARGNANKIALLSEEERKRGVVTGSSGNHGQGFSLAALRNGVKAVVVLPEAAPLNKREKIKQNKAEVIIKGKTYDEAARHAHYLAENEGYIYIPSFDDRDIVAGNGSIGLEILEDVPQADVLICPIGGGGGISGVCLAAKQIKAGIRVIGVEADGAASMLASVRAGKVQTLASMNTFADGIAVARPGDLNFTIVRQCVDDLVTVSDAEMRSAVATLAREAKIVAEGAGAASAAAVLFGKSPIKDKSNVVCMVSGGNIDMDVFRSILEDADRAA